MAVSTTILKLSNETYQARPDYADFESTFAVTGTEGIDFSDVIHEDYHRFWMCDRTWVVEDFLRPFKHYHCYKVSKQQLLDMIPKSLEYVQEDGVIRETETVIYYVKILNQLKELLETFDEETHTLIVFSC